MHIGHREILLTCVMLHFLLNLTMLEVNGLASVSLFHMKVHMGKVSIGKNRTNHFSPSVYTS